MLTPTISDRVRQALGVDLDNFSGGTLSGDIPLTDAFVNRMIAERLAASQGPVGEALVQTQDAEQLTIQLSMRASRMIPSVKIAARIEQQPVPGTGVLGLRWSMPSMGPLALFAAPALSYFKALPPGIHVDGDRISVDVAEVLRTQGMGDLVRYITGLRVTTRSGMFIVQFEMRIP